jgi:hypothetical protein
MAPNGVSANIEPLGKPIQRNARTMQNLNPRAIRVLANGAAIQR